MIYIRTILLSSLIFGIAVALMLPACTEQKRSQGQTGTDTPPATHNYTATKDEPETKMMDSTPPSQGPPTIIRATFPDSAGKTYFNEQVLPRLAENGCVVCHMPGAGYVRPEISYDGLFPFLAMGQAADNNVLMFRIANQRSFAPGQPNHPGGKRCQTEDSDPCKTIKTWWELEFESDSGRAS